MRKRDEESGRKALTTKAYNASVDGHRRGVCWIVRGALQIAVVLALRENRSGRARHAAHSLVEAVVVAERRRHAQQLTIGVVCRHFALSYTNIV